MSARFLGLSNPASPVFALLSLHRYAESVSLVPFSVPVSLPSPSVATAVTEKSAALFKSLHRTGGVKASGQRTSQGRLTGQELLVKTGGRKFDLQLAFLLDCTYSMRPQIDAVKDKIHELMAGIREDFGAVIKSFQIAFVGYRDFGDPTVSGQPFTENVDSFRSVVGQTGPIGGGDTAEDVLGGLMEVNALNWDADVKILLHIADAPAHGARFNGGVDDDYSEERYPVMRETPEALMRSLAEKKVDYYFGRLNAHTDKMTKEYKAMYDSAVAKNMEFTVVDILDFDAATFMDMVTLAVRSTVMSVLSKHFKNPDTSDSSSDRASRISAARKSRASTTTTGSATGDSDLTSMAAALGALKVEGDDAERGADRTSRGSSDRAARISEARKSRSSGSEAIGAPARTSSSAAGDDRTSRGSSDRAARISEARKSRASSGSGR